jgi:long-chain acyl-CoA synthetase
MNIAELLERSASQHPELPAIALGADTRLTYAQLASKAARLARGLVERFALDHGDRVAMIMKNTPAYVELLFAIWHAGLAAVPINAKLHPKELAYILAHSGARLAFASPAIAAELETLREQCPALEHLVSPEGLGYEALAGHAPLPLAGTEDGALAWLFYTSGTTGRPKGAMLSHRNLMAMTVSYLADLDTIEPGDSILHAAPMSHGSGLYILPHIAKAALQIIPESGGFEPEEILALLKHHPRVSFFAAPTMVHRLVAHPNTATADLTNLKTVIYGGGPMYVEDLKRAMKALGPRLAQLYGQGESPMTITCLSKRQHQNAPDDVLGSVGHPFTMAEVRIADGSGQTLPAGEIGEILVRGSMVMSGYWNDPEATASTLKEGWLHTGDMGCFDKMGFLTLKDRSKDLIISGGSNIYPREVEEALLRHPGVLEASVVGQRHADWGEIVIAFIVPKPGLEPEEQELDRLCLENLARFKRPKAYRFLDSLPKNNYGKVLKSDLRQMLEGQTSCA